VQVAFVHHVVVAQDKLAHAGAHEGERRRTAQPAQPTSSTRPFDTRPFDTCPLGIAA
jgi:hypothetical protein